MDANARRQLEALLKANPDLSVVSDRSETTDKPKRKDRRDGTVHNLKRKDDWPERLVNLLLYCRIPEPEREYEFHPVRKWRLDLCWPEFMVGVEVDGGVYSGGRHTRGKGYTEDCVKINEAIILGYTVVRVTTEMVTDGRAVDFVERVLAGKGFRNVEAI